MFWSKGEENYASNEGEKAFDPEVNKDGTSKPAEQKESRNLEDILSENGIYKVNFDSRANKLVTIEGNPWILSKKRLKGALLGYIEANLNTSQSEEFNKSIKEKQNDPNEYLALLEIACEMHFKNKDLPSKIDNFNQSLNSCEARLSRIEEAIISGTNEQDLDSEFNKVTLDIDNQQILRNELQKVNIQKIATSYENKELRNEIKDNWFINSVFYAMTALSSSLLCYQIENAPKTVISEVKIRKKDPMRVV